MTTIIEKARNGRVNAIAGLAHGLGSTGPGARNRSSRRQENVTFISFRARAEKNIFLA